MRLIDADDLIESLEDVIKYGDANLFGKHALSAECILEAVKSMPTVEERPTAKWITDEFPNKNNCYYIQCSRCGKPAIWTGGISYYPPNFCPNCGADMRGDEE